MVESAQGADSLLLQKLTRTADCNCRFSEGFGVEGAGAGLLQGTFNAHRLCYIEEERVYDDGLAHFILGSPSAMQPLNHALPLNIIPDALSQYHIPTPDIP